MNIDYSILPGHMQGGMRRYIEHGIRPGSFLCAVLRNDLLGAAVQGDAVNRQLLSSYADFLRVHAPYACYGSSEALESWIATGGLNG